METEKKRLLSTAKLAELLGYHPATIKRMVAEGRITPEIKSNRSMRFDLDKVKAQLNK